MKKFLALILCLAMILSLTACGGTVSETDEPIETPEVTDEPIAFDESTWTLTMSQDANSTMMEAVIFFAQRVIEATDGAIFVDIYVNNELSDGDTAAGIEMLVSGEAQIGIYSNLEFSHIDERFDAISLPFMFENVDTALTILDGETEFSEIFAENGLLNFGIADSGFRYLMSNTYVDGLDDFAGISVSTADNYVIGESFSALSADLVTGDYTAVENSLTKLDRANMQAEFSYALDWTANYECLFFTVNSAFYEQLDENLQALLDEIIPEVCAYQRMLNVAGETSITSRWYNENGVSVYSLSDGLVATLAETTASVYEDYREYLIAGGYDSESVDRLMAMFD